MKQKFKEAYMDVAERFAELSHARRLQVGCIIVKNDRIISIGYNGTPEGWDNDCEFEVFEDGPEGEVVTLVTKPEVIHAESNAIAKLAKSSEAGDGASLFVTHQPCLPCAKLIYQTGIKEVYYRHSYGKSDGLTFLSNSKINYEKI